MRRFQSFVLLVSVCLRLLLESVLEAIQDGVCVPPTHEARHRGTSHVLPLRQERFQVLLQLQNAQAHVSHGEEYRRETWSQAQRSAVLTQGMEASLVHVDTYRHEVK